jgi:hypothetical protein
MQGPRFGAAFATHSQYVWVRLMQGAKKGLQSVQVTSALEQLLWGVAWGKLDVMVVDMLPGRESPRLASVRKFLKRVSSQLTNLSLDINHMLATANEVVWIFLCNKLWENALRIVFYAVTSFSLLFFFRHYLQLLHLWLFAS